MAAVAKVCSCESSGRTVLVSCCMVRVYFVLVCKGYILSWWPTTLTWFAIILTTQWQMHAIMHGSDNWFTLGKNQELSYCMTKIGIATWVCEPSRLPIRCPHLVSFVLSHVPWTVVFCKDSWNGGNLIIVREDASLWKLHAWKVWQLTKSKRFVSYAPSTPYSCYCAQSCLFPSSNYPKWVHVRNHHSLKLVAWFWAPPFSSNNFLANGCPSCQLCLTWGGWRGQPRIGLGF